MTDTFAIALAQINPVVGDIAGNLALIRRRRSEAAALGADLVVTTELSVSGYPPEDLVLKRQFLEEVRRAVEALAADTADGGPALIVGAPWLDEARPRDPLRKHVTNSAFVLDAGRIEGRCDKHDLPNYGVFDEMRLFKPGPLPGPIACRGVRLGLLICEDVWIPDVCECLQESGAEILIVPNGSPYEAGKADQRTQLCVARIGETGLPLVYVNQVGGQDELVFDGGSFVLDSDYSLRAQLPVFREALALTRWRRDGEGAWHCAAAATEAPEVGMEPIYGALLLGLRDYVNKNRFPGVVLGLSGGIDSALSAAVAVDALGAARVHCVMMPSPFTSRDSLDDAAETARLIGARLDTVEITPAMRVFDGMLAPLFDALPPNTTEENVQARTRMVTLMAISNKLGGMVLSTGNKSEMSVGYATLYGDMAGGYSVLKDVYKTTVYKLARWRNQALPKGALGPAGRVIPERVLTKAPTAELKANQTDQDTLPPYDVLDDILECLIEEEMEVAEIVARGHDRAVVNRVWRMLESAEYKRRQACPGVKITRRAFGRDRRYPIVNAFKGPL
jgi:NAD+ synthase